MRSFTLSSLSYVLAAFALLCCCGVIYAGFAIESAAHARAQAVSDARQQSDQLAYASRVHSLVLDTEAEREQLESLTGADIVDIVTAIESAGVSVHAKVAGAQPEGKPTDLPGGGKLQRVTFVVDAHGSFSQLMRALEGYERFSMPSRIVQADLDHIGGPDGPWHLALRMQVLTSAAISS